MSNSKFVEMKIISSRYTNISAKEEEVRAIKQFVELEAVGYEIGCLGIIDAFCFDDGVDIMTVTKNGEKIFESELNRDLDGNQICILLLSNNVDRFADMIEAYVHSFEGETITQRTIVNNFINRVDRYAISLVAESIDAYYDDLGEDATRFVNIVETARFENGHEKRLFTGFYYGEPSEDFKKYHVNFCEDETEEGKVEGDYYVTRGEKIKIPRPEEFADMIVYMDEEKNIVVERPKEPWE